jgi:O-antigen ligase
MEPEIGRLEVLKVELPGRPPMIAPVSVHNKYLLTAAELGVPGLLLLLWLYLAFARGAWHCSRSADRVFQLVGIAGLAVVVASLTYMMLDLFDDDKSMEFLLFVPVFVSAAARCSTPVQRTLPS